MNLIGDLFLTDATTGRWTQKGSQFNTYVSLKIYYCQVLTLLAEKNEGGRDVV